MRIHTGDLGLLNYSLNSHPKASSSSAVVIVEGMPAGSRARGKIQIIRIKKASCSHGVLVIVFNSTLILEIKMSIPYFGQKDACGNSSHKILAGDGCCKDL